MYFARVLLRLPNNGTPAKLSKLSFSTAFIFILHIRIILFDMAKTATFLAPLHSHRAPNQNVRATLTSDWARISMTKVGKTVFQRTAEDDSSITGEQPQEEFQLPIQHFLTGSSYQGTWNSLGFTGHGTYFFAHGAIYVGNFKNGQFHGKGTIAYPVGHRVKCIHKNGILIDKLFVFADGLEVHDPNTYCQMPDRRFQVEFNASLRGAGNEFQTNRQPTIEIPDGCYDTGDGFYVPSVKCIYKYNEESLEKGDGKPQHKRHTDSLKRTVLVQEGNYIERHYRKSSIDHVGLRPDLYECWVTGRNAEIERAISDLNLKDKPSMKRDVSLNSFDTSSDDQSVNIEFEELKTSY